MSTPPPATPPVPDGEDLRGLARGMRQLLELFSLLDAMDGVGADADVTFVLTVDADLDHVVAEMNSEHQALTRSLLGAGAEGPAREPARPPRAGRRRRP